MDPKVAKAVRLALGGQSVKVALKQTGYPCSEVNLRKHVRNHRVAFSSLAAACGEANLDSAHRDGRRPCGADVGACSSSGRVALAAAVEQGGVVGCWCEPVVSSSRPRFSPLRALLPRSEARWWGCAHHERRVTHDTRGGAPAAGGGVSERCVLGVRGRGRALGGRSAVAPVFSPLRTCRSLAPRPGRRATPTAAEANSDLLTSRRGGGGAAAAAAVAVAAAAVAAAVAAA